MSAVLFPMNTSRQFLLNLSRLSRGGKRQSDVAKSLLVFLEKQPYRPLTIRAADEILQTRVIVKRRLLEELKREGVKVPESFIESTVSLLWSFGLLDFEIYKNRVYVRATGLWKTLSTANGFSALKQPREKLLLALLSGMLFDTPAKLVFKFIASGVRDFDELYKILSVRMQGGMPKDIYGKVGRACTTILASLRMLERPLSRNVMTLRKSGGYPYVGINEVIVAGLSAVGSVVINLAAGSMTLKPPYEFTYRLYRDRNRVADRYVFSAPEVLLIEGEVTGTMQDYGLGTSEEIREAVASSDPYQGRTQSMLKAMRGVFKALKERSAEIESELQLMYGV